MLSTVTKYVLDKIPAWITIPATLVMVPIALVVVSLWFLLLKPSLVKELNASINTRAEITELRYVAAIERQNLINDYNANTIKETKDMVSELYRKAINNNPKEGEHGK